MAAPHQLLCLHGLYQNSKSFAGKCDNLRSALVGLADLHFVDAPLTRVPGILRGGPGKSDMNGIRRKTLSTEELEQYRSWFKHLDKDHPLTSGTNAQTHISRDDPKKQLNGSSTNFELYQESLELLKDVLHQHSDTDGQNFSGVLGFSQGAALAGLLCTKEVSEYLDWKPKVAIFCSGYHHPGDHQLLKDLKSLHLYGKNDHVVTADKSKQLSQLFSIKSDGETEVHSHTQGHIVPTKESTCAAVRCFLERTPPSSPS